MGQMCKTQFGSRLVKFKYINTKELLKAITRRDQFNDPMNGWERFDADTFHLGIAIYLYLSGE